MSDTWAQPGWRSGAHDAISQELNLLGLTDQHDVQGLTDGLASNSPFAQKRLRELLLAADQVKDATAIGPGWTQEQIASLKPGRPRSDFYSTFYPSTTNSTAPTPREFSPGDKQRHEWNNRRRFLETLIDIPEQDASVSAWAGRTDPAKYAEGARTAAYEDYMENMGRTHGTSGFLGAMENPEYTAGKVMTKVLDPMSNAAKYYGRGDADSITEAMQMASDYAGLQEAGNAVSPILPGNPQTRAEQEEEYANLKNSTVAARPKDYRDYYREQTGEWPSYAREFGMEFLANLIDPVTAVATPLAATRGVTGALKAGKGIAKAGPLIRAGAKEVGRETVEELPTYTALMTAFNPPPVNIFSSERPDLKQYSKELGRDLEFQTQSSQNNRDRKAAFDYHRSHVAPMIDQKKTYMNAGYGAM